MGYSKYFNACIIGPQVSCIIKYACKLVWFTFRDKSFRFIQVKNTVFQ